MRFFEDFVVGERELVGTHTVAAGEIRNFAAKWDPQPMHTASDDPIASGAHAMAISARALVTHAPRSTVIAGLGWDEVRFSAPIRPGDELSVWRECIEARLSRTKPGRGVVRNRIVVRNQRSDTVLTYIDAVLVQRRRSTT